MNTELTGRSDHHVEEMEGVFLLKKRGILIIILVCFALIVSGCGKKEVQTATEEKKVPVKVSRVIKGDIVEITTLSGEIQPILKVDVFPKISGKVKAVEVEMGDKVRKGQVLARIDDSDFAAQVKQAKAALAMARAGLEQARANYENARENYEKYKKLYEEGAVSKQQFDSIKLQYEIARAQYEKAQGEVSSTMKGAEAQVVQAEAALELAQSQLDATRITSPISGIVFMKNIEPGEMAAPAAPVFTIVDIDKVVAQVDVSERIVNEIEKGQVVKVKVDAVENGVFKGRITHIAPAADPRTKKFPVKIEIDNPEMKLKGGMFVRVELPIRQRDNVLKVPSYAVIDKGDEKVVFIVQGDRAFKRSVKTGIKGIDGFVEVVSGLTQNDKIVVEGQYSLKDRVLVEIVDGDKK